ncbi:MAG TPA: hypothetical protein PLW48_04620 [Alphaproteobacteria bacterium]|mgnify:CR=1 FL=1|nr:hypothetical protein [Rhodospirillaceae bacterium]HRJ66400.1 hypothetical protein [Alphaproteobacteria bacterium]
MSDGWQTPSIAQSAEILHKINSREPVSRFGSDTALALMPLPFYGAGAQLVRAVKAQAASPAQYYIIIGNDTVPLDGSIANIHSANAAAPLALDESNIEFYLAFRLYFGSAALMLRARAARHDDGWQATARVHDKTGVHELTLHISRRGEVSESHKEFREAGGIKSLPPFAFAG